MVLNSDELVSLVINSVSNAVPFKVHKNMVIIGDNKSGKTKFLRSLFSKVTISKNYDYYYIDAKNRSITDDSENYTNKRYIDYDVLNLVKERTSCAAMTLQDVFTDRDPGALVTISELLSDVSGYSDLFTEIYGYSFRLSLAEVEDQYKDNRDELFNTSKRAKLLADDRDIHVLSSSEQAEIRLMMEIENAKRNNCKIVVIDEFDIHFDTTRMTEFLELICNHYSELRFVFVIHDADAIVDISNMDACIFAISKDKKKHKLINCNDISEYGQIDRLKSRFSQIVSDKEELIEQCVETFVKTGNLSDELLIQFNRLNKDELTGRALVWYRYVSRGIAGNEP